MANEIIKNPNWDGWQGLVANWAKPFQRAGSFPLDRTDIFNSYEDADLYAKGDGTDSRQLGPSAYIGQIITVIQSEKDTEHNIDAGVWTYVLVPSELSDRLAILKEVGAKVESIAENDIYELLGVQKPAQQS